MSSHLDDPEKSNDKMSDEEDDKSVEEFEIGESLKERLYLSEYVDFNIVDILIKWKASNGFGKCTTIPMAVHFSRMIWDLVKLFKYALFCSACMLETI